MAELSQSVSKVAKIYLSGWSLMVGRSPFGVSRWIMQQTKSGRVALGVASGRVALKCPGTGERAVGPIDLMWLGATCFHSTTFLAAMPQSERVFDFLC